MSDPGEERDEHTMQCMEVWGGNRRVDTAVHTSGLDVWLYSEPYGKDRSAEAGGDIHFLTSCATGRITRFLLADVSGHGEAVAEAARSLKKLLADYANYIDPARFLRAVNRRFATLADESARGLFATAVVGTYFAPTREVTLCHAGHPPAMCYQAATNTWRSLESDSDEAAGPADLPLGIDESVEFTQSRVRLERGDTVVLYTDALIEAASPQGRQLGLNGLLREAAALDAHKPETLTSQLIDLMQRHRGGAEDLDFDDDVTLLTIACNASVPNISPAAGVVSACRVARHTARSLLTGKGIPPMPELTLKNIGGTFLRRLNR